MRFFTFLYKKKVFNTDMTIKKKKKRNVTSKTYCMILQTVPTSFELILTMSLSEKGLKTNEEI